MAKNIRMRIQLKDGIANIKLLIFHPMETGLRKHSVTKEIVPEHFIEKMVVNHNGKNALESHWSRAVSRNPFLNFRIRNVKKGDKIAIYWEDNLGENGNTEKIIN